MGYIMILLTSLGFFVPLIWLLYADRKLDKPWRDWYKRNIPKNCNCHTYEDYLLYLESKT